MTQYLNSKFSVHPGISASYRENYDRIFSTARDRELERRVLARAKELNASIGMVTFHALSFSDVAAEDIILDVLDKLARDGLFVKDYRLDCVNGHSILGGPDFPTGNFRCPICDEFLTTDDDDTYVLHTAYLLRV